VVLASRDEGRASDLKKLFPGVEVQCVVFKNILKGVSPKVVVNAAGPYLLTEQPMPTITETTPQAVRQLMPYHCAEQGVTYIDIADNPDYIASLPPHLETHWLRKTAHAYVILAWELRLFPQSQVPSCGKQEPESGP